MAQTVGTCALGSASDTLDVGDVRASLYNNGGFFWRGTDRGYEVPKGGGVHAMWNANLWVAGLAPDGTHRFAGTVYGPWEFWPGPLDTNGNPPDDCADYDRMYSVYDADIRSYEATGITTPDLRDWPHHLGAPVVDGDGIDGNYNLAGGDRPHIYGDQSVWWIMNDVGNEKQWSTTKPMGLELQAQAFAAECWPFDGPRVLAQDRTINQTTFYHFIMIHKGLEPLHDVYLGWWSDGDLGDASDDLVGSDTTLRMTYYYNGDDDDGYLSRGIPPVRITSYGYTPPAIGTLLVRGIDTSHDYRDNDGDGEIDEATERLPFTNMIKYFGDSSPAGNPAGSTIEPYNYMRSIWQDGTHVTYGGSGYNGGYNTSPANFMFPGDPITRSYWSEENTDGSGSRNHPSDRDHLASSGPFDFAPGDTTTFTLAVVWARGDDRFDSIRMLRRRAELAIDAVDQLMTYDAYTCAPPPEPEAPHPDALGYYLLRQNYPEPFSQQTTIRYEVIDTVPVQLHVYDLLGRRVRTLVDGVQDAGVYDVVYEADDLPTGTYFYRLEAAGYVSITRRMVLQR
ncbi:MAG: hypothetical protein RhofKO_12920 [Rhodothermales bacterium]